MAHGQGKRTDIAVRKRGCMGSHSGDFPAFTPAEAATRFSDSGGMQSRVDLGGSYIPR